MGNRGSKAIADGLRVIVNENIACYDEKRERPAHIKMYDGMSSVSRKRVQ